MMKAFVCFFIVLLLVHIAYQDTWDIESGKQVTQTLTAEYSRSSVPLDLVFVLDRSGSIKPSNWDLLLRFVRNVLEHFTVDPDNTRVAIVTFADDASIDIDGLRDTNYTKCTLILHMERVLQRRVPTGNTNTYEALTKAAHVLADSRKSAKKVVIVITDGHSNVGEPPSRASTYLRSLVWDRNWNETTHGPQLEIYAFGIGQVNMWDVRAISWPKDNHSFVVPSFQDFAKIARALHNDSRSETWSVSNKIYCSKRECHENALCVCGTRRGSYLCVCKEGYYGDGRVCNACPKGTYKNSLRPTLCVQCPHSMTTLVEGATNREQCVCKPPYSKNGDSCEIKFCPSLPDIAHGRKFQVTHALASTGNHFRETECRNKPETNCQYHCEDGYALVGDPSLKCALNGSWIGNVPTCKVVDCGSPASIGELPLHGHVLMLNASTTYRSVIRAQCDPGWRLFGDRERVCTKFGSWSGTPAICVDNRCAPIPAMEGLILSPPSCGLSPQVLGSVCQVMCSPGYQLQGPQFFNCSFSGVWDHPSSPVCIDITVPHIECPGDITVPVLRDGYAIVDWESKQPVVSDNSGPVTVQVVGVLDSPVQLSVGFHQLKYIARDKTGNEANCMWKINVQETVIELLTCPEDVVILPKEGHKGVNFPEVTFVDQHNVTLPHICYPSNGTVLPLGRYDIFCRPNNTFDQRVQCAFELELKPPICQHPPPPRNGDLSCSQTPTLALSCIVSCQKNYNFHSLDSLAFVCDYQGEWHHGRSSNMFWPDCSSEYAPHKAVLGGVARYRISNGSCNHRHREISSKFKRFLQEKVSAYCMSGQCSLNSIVVECEPHGQRQKRWAQGESMAEKGGSNVQRHSRWAQGESVDKETDFNIVQKSEKWASDDFTVKNSDYSTVERKIPELMDKTRGKLYHQEKLSIQVLNGDEGFDHENSIFGSENHRDQSSGGQIKMVKRSIMTSEPGKEDSTDDPERRIKDGKHHKEISRNDDGWLPKQPVAAIKRLRPNYPQHTASLSMESPDYNLNRNGKKSFGTPVDEKLSKISPNQYLKPLKVLTAPMTSKVNIVSSSSEDYTGKNTQRNHQKFESGARTNFGTDHFGPLPNVERTSAYLSSSLESGLKNDAQILDPGERRRKENTKYAINIEATTPAQRAMSDTGNQNGLETEEQEDLEPEMTTSPEIIRPLYALDKDELDESGTTQDFQEWLFAAQTSAAPEMMMEDQAYDTIERSPQEVMDVGDYDYSSETTDRDSTGPGSDQDYEVIKIEFVLHSEEQNPNSTPSFQSLLLHDLDILEFRLEPLLRQDFDLNAMRGENATSDSSREGGNSTGDFLRYLSLVIDDSPRIEGCKTGYVVNEKNAGFIQTCVACPSGTQFTYFRGRPICKKCSEGFYQPEEAQQECLKCPGDRLGPLGAYNVSQCEYSCDLGEYSHNGLEPCDPCPKNTYIPIPSAKACIPCPIDKGTEFEGTIDFRHCFDLCQPGTYSASGLAPCTPCPIGYHQPVWEATSCLPCGPNQTTWEEGSVHCTHWFQTCDEMEPVCQNGGSCVGVLNNATVLCECPMGFSGVRCEVNLDDCNPGVCQNNGTCHDGDGSFTCFCAPGFTGPLCEMEIDNCLSSPCQNQGSCLDSVSGYSCYCKENSTGANCETAISDCERPGYCVNGHCDITADGNTFCKCDQEYAGVFCNLTYDLCTPNPCYNEGVCSSVQQGSQFTPVCQCSPHYTGQYCLRLANHCEQNTCSNHSVCISLEETFVCRCNGGWAGDNCDQELSPDFDLIFTPRAPDGQWVVMPSYYSPSISTLTISMWLRPQPLAAFSTIASFSLPITAQGLPAPEDITPDEGQMKDFDVVFAVKNTEGIKLQMFTEEVVTNVVLSPYVWSHLAVTWNTVQGTWQVFTNGTLQNSGVIFATLPLMMTTLVLGQQNPFHPEASSFWDVYVGEMSQFNVFGKVLDANSIQGLANQSTLNMTLGDVISWTDLVGFTQGDLIKREHSRALDVNECFFNPVCGHNTQCVDLIGSYDCQSVCIHGFMGPTCDEPIEECSENPLCLNGECHDGPKPDDYFCDCLPGYTGPVCVDQINLCLSGPCKNGGMCTPDLNNYTCQCPNTGMGPNCELPSSPCFPNPCHNQGYCTETNGSASCLCKGNFFGEFCEEERGLCGGHVCFNGGTCVIDHNTDVMPYKRDGFYCQCPIGWTGRLCDVELILGCVLSPCENGGTCVPVDTAVQGYRCECPFDLDLKMDENCQLVEECHAPCPNNTFCYSCVNSACLCRCLPGHHCDKWAYKVTVTTEGPVTTMTTPSSLNFLPMSKPFGMSISMMFVIMASVLCSVVVIMMATACVVTRCRRKQSAILSHPLDVDLDHITNTGFHSEPADGADTMYEELGDGYNNPGDTNGNENSSRSSSRSSNAHLFQRGGARLSASSVGTFSSIRSSLSRRFLKPDDTNRPLLGNDDLEPIMMNTVSQSESSVNQKTRLAQRPVSFQGALNAGFNPEDYLIHDRKIATGQRRLSENGQERSTNGPIYINKGADSSDSNRKDMRPYYEQIFTGDVNRIAQIKESGNNLISVSVNPDDQTSEAAASATTSAKVATFVENPGFLPAQSIYYSAPYYENQTTVFHPSMPNSNTEPQVVYIRNGLAEDIQNQKVSPDSRSSANFQSVETSGLSTLRESPVLTSFGATNINTSPRQVAVITPNYPTSGAFSVDKPQANRAGYVPYLDMPSSIVDEGHVYSSVTSTEKSAVGAQNISAISSDNKIQARENVAGAAELSDNEVILQDFTAKSTTFTADVKKTSENTGTKNTKSKDRPVLLDFSQANSKNKNAKNSVNSSKENLAYGSLPQRGKSPGEDDRKLDSNSDTVGENY